MTGPALPHADVSDPRLYREDSWRPHFARLRREDPVHYHAQSPYGPYWSVTRYADIMKVELDPGDLFVGLGVGRHPDRRPGQGPGAAELHPHGSAAPHRATQDRGADRGALKPRQYGNDDPPAHRGGARRPAARPAVRLGRPRLDRAYGDDAGDPVRLPVAGPPQAHPLVGRRHRQHRGRRCRGEERVRAHGRAHADGRDHGGAVARARRSAAQIRPDLDDGACRGDARPCRCANSSAISRC